jgi:hypothetical protein
MHAGMQGRRYRREEGTIDLRLSLLLLSFSSLEKKRKGKSMITG